MDRRQAPYPRRLTLWQGAVLGTIAHAIWVASDPSLAAAQSWDGPNYSLNNSSGARGTVTFAHDHVVGAFFDEHSPRNPFRSGARGAYTVDGYFSGAPADVLALARRETLQYLLDDYRGSEVPVVTAAFWDAGDALTATEPWAEVVEHGAHLIFRQVLEPDEAVLAWQEDYELSAAQIALLHSLYRRRLATPDQSVTLEEREFDALVAGGADGIDESRTLLAAIGIVLPW